MSVIPTAPVDDADGARVVGKGDATAAGPGPAIMAASTIDGDHVLSAEGEQVGKLKEIMLDVQSGRIAYAVMASGGVLGIGEKLLAIPWHALTLDTTRKCFVLNVTSAQVNDAPGFDKEHWPAMADPAWAASLHEYYGAPPWWDEPRDYRSETPAALDRPGGPGL